MQSHFSNNFRSGAKHFQGHKNFFGFPSSSFCQLHGKWNLKKKKNQKLRTCKAIFQIISDQARSIFKDTKTFLGSRHHLFVNFMVNEIPLNETNWEDWGLGLADWVNTEHTRMPFGRCNAPGTIKRVMNNSFRDLNCQILLEYTYLEDILEFGKTNSKQCCVVLEAKPHNLKLQTRKGQ